MKNYLLLLFVMLVASPAFSLNKDKDKPDPKDLKIDSLTQACQFHAKQADSMMWANFYLNEHIDSINLAQMQYHDFYTVIKEKIIKHDFDPSRIALIIDSLAANKDTTFIGIKSAATYLADTVAMLQKELAMMKAKFGESTVDDATKAKLVKELKELKYLLDSQIITQSEFDIKKTIILHKWE